jgi:molybdate transport system ATP-binding protein
VSTELHVLFNASALAKRCTAEQVILSAGGVDGGGTQSPERRAACAALALALSLTKGVLAKGYRHLSQGQQRLVLICRALLDAPPLLVMDEMCQGLDAGGRRRVLALLNYCVKGGACLVAVSHHGDELAALECCENELALVGGEVTVVYMTQ